MKIDLPALGAGLLSGGTVLVTLAPFTAAYWLGFAFVVVGPVLLAFRHRK